MKPDYEKLATEAAGNHRRFESFAWHARPKDDGEWTLVYTHNRDSGAIERANAQVIDRRMAPYVQRGWATEEHHGHWAVGWVEGFAIRVRRPDGKVSRAFRAWCDIQAAIEEYPVLDEELLSNLECEEVNDHWGGLSRRDRVELCKEMKESPFAARREVPPDRVFYRLRDLLC